MASPSKLVLDDQLCFALYAATNAVTRAYRPLLKCLDLTYPQYLVMLVLWQDGPRSARSIADRLKLPPNAISPLIDRLEAAGLISRRRDGEDRRIVHISLTGKGAALERAAAEAQGAVACRAGMSEAQMGALRDELHRLTGRLALEPCDAFADEIHRGSTVKLAEDEEVVR